MQSIKASFGDKVWIYRGSKKVQGMVVNIFELYSKTYYVVEIETSVEPILEVRDEFTISDAETKDIGLWRR